MSSVPYSHTDRLSQREKQVLQGIFDQLGDYDRVAEKLFIEPCTVKTHMTRIFGKLRVTTKTAAVIQGIRQGFISVDGQYFNSPSSFQ